MPLLDIRRANWCDLSFSFVLKCGVCRRSVSHVCLVSHNLSKIQFQKPRQLPKYTSSFWVCEMLYNILLCNTVDFPCSRSWWSRRDAFDRISCARNRVESAFEFRYPRLKTTPKTIARKLTFRSLPASQHEKTFRKPDFLAVLDRVT
jgi:hypothetical protein